MLAQLDAGDYLLLQNEISNLTYLLRTAVRRGHARAARQSWQGRGFFPAIRCWGPSQRGSA